MSITRIGVGALVDLRDEVAALHREQKAQGKRLTQAENAFTELGRHQRVIIGKLEEFLELLREALPRGKK